MFLSNYLLTKILAIFFLVALIIFIILYVVTDKIYKGIYGRRFDKTFLHFFTHEDFDGLKIDPFEFKTNNDNTLKGNNTYTNQLIKLFTSMAQIGLLNDLNNIFYEENLCLCRAVARLDAARCQACEKRIVLEYEWQGGRRDLSRRPR